MFFFPRLGRWFVRAPAPPARATVGDVSRATNPPAMHFGVETMPPGCVFRRTPRVSFRSPPGRVHPVVHHPNVGALPSPPRALADFPPPDPPPPKSRSGFGPGKPRVKTLILGANFGTSLAAEIAASGDKRLISDDGVAQHVTRPLLEVAGVPALEWWLRALRRCPHTSDVSDIHVIANQENVIEYVNWTLDENPAKCGGFDRGNVVNDGAAPDGARRGPAGDLLAALENAIGYDDHLLLIDGDHVPEPNFDIGTIIDHAAARGRDTLTYIRARGSSSSSDSDASESLALRLACGADGAPLSNPEVLGALAYPSDAAAARAAGYTAAAGPVMFLRKGTLPWVSRFFEDVGDLEPAHQSLGRLVAYLRGKVPMRALEIKHVFPLKTLAEYTRADALFRFHAERREEAERALGGAVVAGAASDATTRKRMLTERFAREDARFGNARARAVAGALDMDLLTAKFEASRRDAVKLDAPPPERGSVVPERFADASLWRGAAPEQHPCYVTSSVASYGKKMPTQPEMPTRWHGIRGEFTDGFGGNMYRDGGFVMGVDKSKVHPSADGVFS